MTRWSPVTKALISIWSALHASTQSIFSLTCNRHSSSLHQQYCKVNQTYLFNSSSCSRLILVTCIIGHLSFTSSHTPNHLHKTHFRSLISHLLPLTHTLFTYPSPPPTHTTPSSRIYHLLPHTPHHLHLSITFSHTPHTLFTYIWPPPTHTPNPLHKSNFWSPIYHLLPSPHTPYPLHLSITSSHTPHTFVTYLSPPPTPHSLSTKRIPWIMIHVFHVLF